MMRKSYIIVSLVTLFCSLNFTLYGQDRECSQDNLAVDINITWDANFNDLEKILDDTSNSFFLDLSPIPESFHIAELPNVAAITPSVIETIDLFVTNSPINLFESTAYSFNMFVSSEKPVIFVVKDVNDIQEISSGIVDISGIATSIGVMMLQVESSPLSSEPIEEQCIRIHFTNIIGYAFNGQCNMEDKSVTSCEFRKSNREAQDINTPSVSIKVYPNPVENNMFVETSNINVKEIKLFNLNGQIQNHQISIRYGIDRIQINTSQLQSGIYLLELETETETVIKKVIIQ